MVMQFENPSTSAKKMAREDTREGSTEERPYLKGIVRQLRCICQRLERIEKCVNKENAICFKIQEALADNDSWIVWGRVLDQQNSPVEGLVIALFDHDRGCDDDHLGTVQTDEAGEFCIVYTTSQFRDWYGDNRPNLYLIGRDTNSNQVFLFGDPIRWQADHLERFYITLQSTGAAPQ